MYSGTKSYIVRVFGSLYRKPTSQSRTDGTLSSQLPSSGANILLLLALLHFTAHVSDHLSL